METLGSLAKPRNSETRLQRNERERRGAEEERRNESEKRKKRKEEKGIALVVRNL